MRVLERKKERQSETNVSAGWCVPSWAETEYGRKVKLGRSAWREAGLQLLTTFNFAYT